MTATEVQEFRAKAHECLARARVISEAIPKGETGTEEQLREIDEKLKEAETFEKRAKQSEQILKAEREKAERAAKDEKNKKEKSERKSEEELARDGFLAYLRHGGTFRSQPNVDREAIAAYDRMVRDASANIDTNLGYLMAPPTFMSEILREVDDRTFMRQMGRVLPSVAPNSSLGYLYGTDGTLDMSWSAELAKPPVTDIAFQAREMKPSYMAGRVKFSRVLLAGNTINAEAYVRERMAYKESTFLERAYMTGNGVNQPLGLFITTDQGIPADRDTESDTTNAIGYDDVINVFWNLKEQYMRNATWLLNRAAMKQIVLIKDGDQRPLWREGLAPGDPSMLLGRPLVMSEFAPSGTRPGGGFRQGEYMLCCGDFNQYWIVDSTYMEVQRLEELYAENNQVGVIWRRQSDAAPQLAEAFSRLKSA